MAAFQSSTEKFRCGGAFVMLSHMGDDIWSLHTLESENKGQGDARKVMEQAMGFADQYHLTLLLVVQAFGRYDEKMMDNIQLEQFYMKFGFERTDTRPVRMIRHPQGHI